MPDASFTPSTPTYDFIRVTGQPYNIYIEDGQAPTKYLTITGNKQLVFQDYDESSKFSARVRHHALTSSGRHKRRLTMGPLKIIKFYKQRL